MALGFRDFWSIAADGVFHAMASTPRGFDFQSRMSLTWSFSGGMAPGRFFFNDGTQKLHTSRASFVEDWRCWTLKRYDIVYKHILLCRDMIIKKHIYVCRIHSIKMRSFFQKHGNAGPPTTSQTSKKRATERVKLDTLCFDVFFSSFSQRFHVNAFWKGDLASCLDLIDCGLLGMYHQAFFLNWVSYLALPQAESAPQPSSERRKGEKKGWEILHHLGCIKAL